MITPERFQTFWTKVNEALFVPPAGVKRSDFSTDIMYRGLPNSVYDLTTALQRLSIKVRRQTESKPVETDDDLRSELQYRERRLIDSFRKYGRSLLPFGTTDWDVMVIGQHHRLPTRLMDWTLSPLVALFFASESASRSPDEPEPDGVVWCVSHSATFSVCDASLRNRLLDAKKGSADLEFMNRFSSIEEFDSEPYQPSLLWFEPHSFDQRIVNQFAFFSLMQGAATRVNFWLDAHQEVHWKVIVPGEFKALLRRRLYLLNVTDRTLFPGLEGIARW